MNSRPDENKLDVIVRFHSPEWIAELKNALLSLVCSSYRPLTINIVTQRFTAEQLGALSENTADIFSMDGDVEVRILNHDAPGSHDARSALLNLAISETRGRYLGILDYDDVIYPQAYFELIDMLRSCQAAIAFGRISVKIRDVFADALICTGRQFPFTGSSLRDLFFGNFCPIHSYVIDRNRVERSDLLIDEQLSRLEDYEFLLRVTAKYPVLFSETAVGDYYFKNDGSNSSLVGPHPNPGEAARWASANAYVERRRQAIRVSAEVQRSLGLFPAEPNLTVRQLLDRPFQIQDELSKPNYL